MAKFTSRGGAPNPDFKVSFKAIAYQQRQIKLKRLLKISVVFNVISIAYILIKLI